jgi:hypothetical protein
LADCLIESGRDQKCCAPRHLRGADDALSNPHALERYDSRRISMRGFYRRIYMMKPFVVCLVAGLALGIGSASARDLHGTTNSTIGNDGASTGTNGTEHSTANRGLNPGNGASERSVNGTANSTIGSGGGAAGMNGATHSTTNRALNGAK